MSCKLDVAQPSLNLGIKCQIGIAKTPLKWHATVDLGASCERIMEALGISDNRLPMEPELPPSVVAPDNVAQPDDVNAMLPLPPPARPPPVVNPSYYVPEEAQPDDTNAMLPPPVVVPDHNVVKPETSTIPESEEEEWAAQQGWRCDCKVRLQGRPNAALKHLDGATPCTGQGFGRFSGFGEGWCLELVSNTPRWADCSGISEPWLQVRSGNAIGWVAASNVQCASHIDLPPKVTYAIPAGGPPSNQAAQGRCSCIVVEPLNGDTDMAARFYQNTICQTSDELTGGKGLPLHACVELSGKTQKRSEYECPYGGRLPYLNVRHYLDGSPSKPG